MIHSAEVSRQHQSERSRFRAEWDDPLELDIAIESQEEDVFWPSFDAYSAALQGDDWQALVPEFSRALVRPTGESRNARITFEAKFCALFTAVEARRTFNEERGTSSHEPTWEQAAASLHLLNNPHEKRVQEILMATGEGKTFAIAMASAWDAINGRPVAIHTDKQANVNQSYEKTKSLYELFELKSGMAVDPKQGGQNYALDLGHSPELIRYGTYGQFMHEYITRQTLTATGKALLRGDMADQRSGKLVLTDKQREQIQKNIDFHQKWLLPTAIHSDEGDKSRREPSPVILTEPLTEDIPQVEAEGIKLAWEVFNRDQTPEALERMAHALGVPFPAVREQYRIVPEELVEGMQEKDQSYIVSSQTIDYADERLLGSQVLEMITTPDLFANLIRVAQMEKHDEAAGDLPSQQIFDQAELDRLAAVIGKAKQEGAINWREVVQALPPVSREDIRLFLGDSENPLFNHAQNIFTPEIRTILESDEDEISGREWTLLEHKIPLIRQQLAVVKLYQFADTVWTPLYSQYQLDALRVRFLFKEGDKYNYKENTYADPNDPTGNTIITEKMIELLDEDHQPQPRKQHQGMIQAFLHLRHGMDLPKDQRTVAQILPASYYDIMAQLDVLVNSISGTQDNPDYIVPSTGKGKVETFNRVLPDKKTKLRAISHYTEQNLDRPIVVCAQNIKEFQALQESFSTFLDPQDLIVIDSEHADSSYEAVSRLEPGKVLLLQMSARGLDFGHLLAEDEQEIGENGQPKRHSFENGLVISASSLGDIHQQKQLEGRLGGKRPSGRVVTFTALDDEVAEKRYVDKPKLIKERTKALRVIEAKYLEIRAEFADYPQDIGWPPSFAEAIIEIDRLDDDELPLEGEEAPLWLRIMTNDQTLPADLRGIAKKFKSTFRSMERRYETVRRGHIDTVEQQQRINLGTLQKARRESVVIDQAIQNVWHIIVMNPDERNPLGKAVLPLTFEERVEIMSRIYSEASSIYSLSMTHLKMDTSASEATQSRLRYERFFVDLTERVIDWVDMNHLYDQYIQLREEVAHIPPFDTLPPETTKGDELEKLRDWYGEHAKKPPKRNLFKEVFLGLQQMASVHPGSAEIIIPPLPEPSPEPTEEERIMAGIKTILDTYESIGRKYRAVV